MAAGLYGCPCLYLMPRTNHDKNKFVLLKRKFEPYWIDKYYQKGGKPAALLLLAKNATVTICHSRTKNLKEVCAAADILVAAVGREGFVTGDMVKPGAVVIDVGINRGADGKLHGDVNFAEAAEKAAYITPVPGGVGPMTRAMLMLNTVEAAEQQGR